MQLLHEKVRATAKNMAHLLHLDGSPRGERSRSRQLTKEFVEAWQQAHPTDSVTYRDVGRNPVPHVNESWVAAAFSPPEKHTLAMSAAIQISDRLIDEFLAADIYVLGVPMCDILVGFSLRASWFNPTYLDENNNAENTSPTEVDPQAFYYFCK